MSVMLSDNQQTILKGMMDYAKAFADGMLKVMNNHGLDKIEGCKLSVIIDPSCHFATEQAIFGKEGSKAGRICLTKGRCKVYEDFVPTGKNSTEYEYLFADETVRSIFEKRMHREKPLPPDGLWVSDSRYDSPVDHGEWDINDSLS